MQPAGEDLAGGGHRAGGHNEGVPMTVIGDEDTNELNTEDLAADEGI